MQIVDFGYMQRDVTLDFWFLIIDLDHIILDFIKNLEHPCWCEIDSTGCQKSASIDCPSLPSISQESEMEWVRVESGNEMEWVDW